MTTTAETKTTTAACFLTKASFVRIPFILCIWAPCDRICITLLLCYCSPAWLRLFTVCLLHTTDIFCLLQSLCTLYFNLYAHSFAIYMYAKAVGIRTTTSLSLLLFFPVFCMDGSRFFYSYLTVERCWYDMNVFSPVNIFIIHILYMAKICANLYGTVASATFQRDMFRGADGVNVESAIASICVWLWLIVCIVFMITIFTRIAKLPINIMQFE